jgi:hypothetical protein
VKEKEDKMKEDKYDEVIPPDKWLFFSKLPVRAFFRWIWAYY